MMSNSEISDIGGFDRNIIDDDDSIGDAYLFKLMAALMKVAVMTIKSFWILRQFFNQS